jgi:uncharacterized membrane protein YhhN
MHYLAKRNAISFSVFVIAAAIFSYTREEPYGYLTKIIPIVLLLIFSWRAVPSTSRNIVQLGLLLSMAGDVLLEWQNTTAGVAIFVVVMLLYSVYFTPQNKQFKVWLLSLYIVISAGIYIALFPALGEMKISGAIYQIVICVMLWRASAMINSQNVSGYRGWFAFLGALGIALNGILYAVNLYIFEVNRDFVIQLYYFGQLGVVLSLEKSTRE